MGPIAAILLRAGVPAGAVRWAVMAITAVAAALLGTAGAALWLHAHDRAVLARHDAAELARSVPARDAAAAARAADAIANSAEQEQYDDAIARTPADAPPDPAARALGCERLRRAALVLPAACGPQRGERGQAGPHR